MSAASSSSEARSSSSWQLHLSPDGFKKTTEFIKFDFPLFSFIGGYRTAFVAAIFFRIVRKNNVLSSGAFLVVSFSEPAFPIGIVLVNFPSVPGKVLANHVGKIADLLALSILFSVLSADPSENEILEIKLAYCR